MKKTNDHAELTKVEC